jgi:hypothetical protein
MAKREAPEGAPEAEQSLESSRSSKRRALLPSAEINPLDMSLLCYDAKADQIPTNFLYERQYEILFSQGMHLAKDMAEAIGAEFARKDDDIARAQKEALKLSNFQTTETTTIALLGDSGEG